MLTSIKLSLQLAVFIAYYVSGALGLLMPYVGTHITLIWLPTGIAVAAFLRCGYRLWPAVFLGAMAVNMSIGSSPLLALSIASGNTLGPLLCAWLLNRCKFKLHISRLRDMLVLVVSASCGMIISSIGGISSLYYHGILDASQVKFAWLVWWLGDAVGVLLVLPLLLAVSKASLMQLWQLRGQYLSACGLVFLIEICIFQLVPQNSGQFALLALLVLPMVIWIAMRYGIVGASLAVLGLSIIAVIITVHAQGPFNHDNMQDSILSLWVFMCVLAMVVVMIALLQAERMQTEHALRDSEARFRAVVDGALDGVVTMDEDGYLVEFNRAAERIFGYTRNEVIGRLLSEVIIPPSSQSTYSASHQYFLQTRQQHIFDRRLELWTMRADGSAFPIELTITSLQDKGLPLVTLFIRDITERKQAEENIHSLAFFDALTGLPNRRLLVERLKQALANSSREQMHGAVLFIDLDNFKSLNDSRGHDVGDLLLQQVALRLKACVRAQDTISRLGGDEFVAVLEGLHAQASEAVIMAKQVGQKILDEINRPYILQNLEHHNSSSIGVSLFQGEDIHVEELLKRADTAMYEAKSAGRDTQRFFDPAMQAAIDARVELETELRLALQQNQLELYFQVQMSSEGIPFGAEVLLRWNHPFKGLVMPAQFIPVAEASGQIVVIGRWVIHSACQQLKCWENIPYAKQMQLAVNVSMRQFRQADFVAEVRACLDETGANPELLKLELTESVAIEDINDTITKMLALRVLGVNFSMDDFGTGFSSLSYLKQLPLHQVKIDRSFLRDITFNPSDATIVQAIIVMGRTLGLNVIAEGVETEEQFSLLKHYGCDQFQGYLFSKPVSLEAFDILLQTAADAR